MGSLAIPCSRFSSAKLKASFLISTMKPHSYSRCIARSAVALGRFSLAAISLN
jgi:hypothetical protein